MARFAARITSGRGACVAGLMVLVLCLPLQAKAQQVVELTTPEEAIPATFESWSLFLICNPQWLLPEAKDRLEALYHQFEAFGWAIGPAHAAVWFWSRPDLDDIRSAVDVVRSSAYCSLLDLPLGQSPYVVVTTDYPGEAMVGAYPDTFRKPDNFYVLALDGLEASEATTLLTELAERIVEERLEETNPASEDFWRTWQRSFEALRSTLVGFSNRIRVSFNTQFFTVEYDPE